MPNKTIYDIRRENLERLLEPRGARTALAAKLGSTQSNVSHFLRKSGPYQRLIHEDTARAIETAIGLDPGALDWVDGKRPPAVAAVPRTKGVTGAVDVDLLAQTIRAVVSLAASQGKEPINERLADVVTVAYEHNRSTGRCDEEFITNLLRLL